MFCSNCGKEIENNVNFCPWCGGKISPIIQHTKDMTPQKNKSIPRPYVFPVAFECSVAFDIKFHQYNQLRSEFFNRGSSTEILGGMMFGEKCTTFDAVFNEVLPWSIESIKETIDYAISILIKFGIDYIDKKTFLDEINEKAEKMGVFNDLANAEKIIEDLKHNLNIANGNNSYWMGGGFGITGAIKGAITAEVLNIGTNALGGAIKSLTGNTDNDKIERMKKKLFSEMDLIGCCTHSITVMSMEIFYIMHKLLVSNGFMPIVEFDEKKAIGKFNNIKDMYEKEKLTKRQAVEAVCECIEMYPYFIGYYLFIYNLSLFSEDNLNKLTSYLGMGNMFMAASNLVDNKYR